MLRVLALVAGLLCAGCVGPGSTDNDVEPAAPMDEDCLDERSVQVLAWEHSPTGSEASAGTMGFEAPEGTAWLVVDGSSGTFAQARWSFEVTDGDGQSVWTFAITGPVTAVGDDNNVPRGVKAPMAPGPHKLSWEVDGAVTDLALDLKAIVCG